MLAVRRIDEDTDGDARVREDRIRRPDRRMAAWCARVVDEGGRIAHGDERAPRLPGENPSDWRADGQRQTGNELRRGVDRDGPSRRRAAQGGRAARRPDGDRQVVARGPRRNMEIPRVDELGRTAGRSGDTPGDRRSRDQGECASSAES